MIDFDQFKKVLIRVATLAATENHADGINTKIDQEAALKKKNKKTTKQAEQDAISKEESFMDKM